MVYMPYFALTYVKINILRKAMSLLPNAVVTLGSFQVSQCHMLCDLPVRPAVRSDVPRNFCSIYVEFKRFSVA